MSRRRKCLFILVVGVLAISSLLAVGARRWRGDRVIGRIAGSAIATPSPSAPALPASASIDASPSVVESASAEIGSAIPPAPSPSPKPIAAAFPTPKAASRATTVAVVPSTSASASASVALVAAPASASASASVPADASKLAVAPEAPAPSASQKLPKIVRMIETGSTIHTGIPPEVVRRVVRSNFPRFRQCYEEGLKHDAKLKGVVTIRFVIGLDGGVTSATVASTTMPDGLVVECVRGKYATLHFPAPDGPPVTVTYPIDFQNDP